MSDTPKREVVTIDGATVTLRHPVSPIDNTSVEDGAAMLRHLDVLDPRFRPENYNKADGAPLRLFDSDGVKIDLSKRSREDMGFWHRNVDCHEVIFCFRGALWPFAPSSCARGRPRMFRSRAGRSATGSKRTASPSSSLPSRRHA